MGHKDDVLKESLIQLELHLYTRLKHGGSLLLSEIHCMHRYLLVTHRRMAYFWKGGGADTILLPTLDFSMSILC